MWLLPRRIKTSLTVVMVGCAMLGLGMETARAVGVTPAILDLQLQPGEVVQRTVTVVNTEDTPRTFHFLRENFSPSDEPGIPLFDGGAHDDFPSWISIDPARVTIPSLGEAQVTLTVAIPVDAPRGDMYGTIFVAPDPAGQTSARTAILLFLTVLGEAQYDFDLGSLHLAKRWASSIENTASVRVQNTGNVYVKPEGRLVIDPLIGLRRDISGNPEALRVLSGESRSWDVAVAVSEEKGVIGGLLKEWRGFALGPVRATLTLVVGPEHDRVEERISVSYVVFPWRTAVLLTLMILLGRVFLPKRKI